MKNFKVFALFLIFFLALFVRLYRLGNTPYGFHFDEVKAGWNAYSIWKSGMDDKGNKLPLYYDSFGDYRPAGIIYSIIPSLIIFGKTIFAVRLPSALIGALTIIPIFLIVQELFVRKKNNYLGLIASLLLALNPWHITISRATSESVICIFLSLTGLYFLIRTIKSGTWWNTTLSVLFFGSSYFFYHSIRILAPLFVAATIIAYWGLIKKEKYYLKPVLILIALLVWTGMVLSSKESKGRLSQVSLISDFQVSYEVQRMPNEEGPNNVFVARAFHNRIASYIRRFVDEYKNYFSIGFFLGDNMAKPIRYNTPYVGLLTYNEFILLILGIMMARENKELGIFLLLLILAPLPAAVTNEDTPNLQRASLMIPFLILIETYGVYFLMSFKAKRILLSLFSLVYLANFIYFAHMYMNHQKYSLTSYYRNGGTEELVDKLNKVKGNYDKIIITNYPDNVISWFAFFSQNGPEYFQNYLKKAKNGVQTIDNLVFSDQRCPSSQLSLYNEIPRILLVDAEGCDPPSGLKLNETVLLKETIKRPDLSPTFYLRERLFSPAGRS